MNGPAVSIVIPCYNAQGYVGEAIQSALDQTYPRKEVIVIDDGSTDASLDIVRSFGDRIRWESGPNRGACAARNRGLELAQGEFIQFLDADDLLHANKLERQVAATDERQRQVSISYGAVVPPDDALAAAYRRPMRRDDSVIFALEGVLQTSAPLHIRSELTAIGGFTLDLPCSQERDLHLRLACAGVQFKQLPEVLFTVRRQAGSVSSNYVRVLAQHLAIIERAEQVLARSGSLTPARRRAVARLLAEDAKQLIFRGAYREAARYFGAARGRCQAGVLDAFPRSLRLCARLQPMLAAYLIYLKRRAFAGKRSWSS